MASKIPLNTIFNMDCLEGMKGLPDGCIEIKDKKTGRCFR